MNEPESSHGKKSPRRRKRGQRICLRILISLLILIPCVYVVERIRGRKALEKAIAEYETEGESLHINRFLTKAPLPDQNFGATPLLDGIMATDDTEGQESPANRKRLRLRNLNPGTFEGMRTGAVFFYEAPAKNPFSHGNAKSPTKQNVHRRPEHTIDWHKARQHLFYHSSAEPPTNEPSDVVAVDRALESERALFDELIAAADRRYSVFTPAPADRPLFADQSAEPYFLGSPWSSLGCLSRFVRLRVLAASTLGRHQEAAALSKIFWRLREAKLCEPGLNAYYAAGDYGGLWSACVRDTIRSTGVSDSTLTTLQQQVPTAWSPEQELLAALRCDAALSLANWKRIIFAAENSFTGDLYGAFKERHFDGTRTVLLCPSGWLSQNAAESLRRTRVFSVLPARMLDFAALPAAESIQNNEDAERGWFSVYSNHIAGHGNICTLELGVIHPMRIRLSLLALGMERHRLKHGRYPSDTGWLVPDCMVAVPQDIDGAPLRDRDFFGWNGVGALLRWMESQG